ncbi:hypothetical protein [Puniceibacterium sediminis]|uniref:Uncharacterized protein n=1 Tax=Puniceibacterium sediminis TaxID=1608407 RepID=A0A238VER5_9RHOB|nr:hypothetical protein [Puniceibacterium sediminis]SNR32746.1 hypothetical protein SAMN06265370_10247 [Puniceibacterium sediminis]
MDGSPHVLEVLLGLLAASIFAILAMYVGGQFFEWDIPSDAPIWLGLFIYIAFGGLLALLLGVLALLLWVVLCWRRSFISWLVPPIIGSIILGGFLGFSGNLTYALFGFAVGGSAGTVFWLVTVGKERRVFLAFKS